MFKKGTYIVKAAPCLLGMTLFLSPTGRAQTVGLPPKPTPNEVSMAGYLQKVCVQLEGSPASEPVLTPGQQDLVQRCQFFQSPNATPAALSNGYLSILGQQINALGPQTKKFGSLQQDNLASRLAELRHGATGASLSGLTLTQDDGTVLASGNQGISGFLPGGASGDGNGEWLDGRLGIFANGSLQGGSKRKSANSYGFDISDNSVTVGADYRIGQHFVVGAAVGSGKTTTDFANSFGRLDLSATGVSVYASLYGSTFYVDALAGYGRPNLNTTRHIQYAESAGMATIDQDALGHTHLHDLWSGISFGRPFNWKAFTLTPEGSLNFHEVRLDEFSESMSSPNRPGAGLGLTFGQAVVPSLQGRAGLRAAYTFSGGWGVFEPHLHGAFIREFRNHPDDFTARFENAPQGTSDLGSLTLQTDPPEGHYFGAGGGVSFQLAHSVSGFVDYEQLKVLKTIKSHEISFGMRYQFGM